MFKILKFCFIYINICFICDRIDSCVSNCICNNEGILCSNQSMFILPSFRKNQYKYLNLSDNNFHSIDFSFCQTFQNLTSLNLSKNKISTLKFNNLCHISNLDFSYNKLEHLDHNFLTHFPQLNNLKLSNNKFLSFPSVLQNSRLQNLNLANNKIRHINATDLSKFVDLKELEISSNFITALTKNYFSSVPSLQLLNLESNEISSIEGLTFYGLHNLVSLSLRRNNITSLLDASFWGLSKLRHLDLSFNRIISIDHKWLYGLTTLGNLNLAHNRIIEIGEGAWSSTPNLTELNLRWNNLEVINSTHLNLLTNLRIINWQHNRIKIITASAFTNLRKLRSLDLSYNQLLWVINIMDGVFDNLSSLVNLNLENNYIKSIPANAFKDLKKLQILNLANNEIVRIEQGAFDFLKDLSDLNMTSSSILCDCHVNHLIKVLKRLNVNSTAVCSLPLPLKSYKIIHLQNTEEFKCKDDLFSSPQLLNQSGNIEILNGSNSTLSCTAVSSIHLPVTITWYNNGQLIRLKDKISEKRSGDGRLIRQSQLFLQSASTQHNIHIKMNASNVAIVIPSKINDQKARKDNLSLNSDETSDHLIDHEIITKITVIDPIYGQTHVDNLLKDANRTFQQTSGTKFVEFMPNNKEKTDSTRVANELNKQTSNEIFGGMFSNKMSADGIVAGEYGCLIWNALGAIHSNTSFININIPASFVNLPSSVMLVAVGSTAQFDCSATGIPMPVISLQKVDSIDFPAAAERRLHIYPEDDVFFIVDVQPRDEGVYACHATNRAADITANLTLKVIDKGLVGSRHYKVLKEGDTIVLDCQMKSAIHVTPSWRFNNLNIIATPRHIPTANLLIVTDARMDDSGVYLCHHGNVAMDTIIVEVVASTDSVAVETNKGMRGKMIGVIIIAIVSCVVGTSIVWVCFIYKSHRRSDTKLSWKSKDFRNKIQLYSCPANASESLQPLGEREFKEIGQYFPSVQRALLHENSRDLKSDSGTHSLSSDVSVDNLQADFTTSPTNHNSIRIHGNCQINKQDKYALSSVDIDFPDFKDKKQKSSNSKTRITQNSNATLTLPPSNANTCNISSHIHLLCQCQGSHCLTTGFQTNHFLANSGFYSYQCKIAPNLHDSGLNGSSDQSYKNICYLDPRRYSTACSVIRGEGDGCNQFRNTISDDAMHASSVANTDDNLLWVLKSP